jgi:hypothetical protein
MKTILRGKSLLRLSVFSMILLSCFAVVRSQTPLAISVPSNIVGSAFSPCIAAFSNSGTRTLVAAYTYVKTGNTNRTVAISTSTDAGSTWTVQTPSGSPLPFPNYGGGSALDNMDEAQIIWCGGNNLMLVVRAWSGANVEGARFQEQANGSVYTKVGIYQCVSTDGGTTWGVVTSGSLAAGWLACEENNGSHTTLECPHIAFRWNYGIYAYPYQEAHTDDQNSAHIIWTKKVFSSAPNWTGVTCTIGHQEIPVDDASNFGNFTGIGCSHPTLTTGSYGSGPERASVAIAPNGDVWVGYYTVNYNSFLNTTPGALAHYFVYNITGGAGKEVSSTNFTLPGTPDNRRGYVYSDDFTDAWGNNTWDLAQGPSIEIVCRDAQFNCHPDYQIGLAYTTVDHFGDAETRIAVRIANSTWGLSASSLVFSDGLSGQAAQNETNGTMRYFPVLKHAEATDNLLTYKVSEGVASGFNPSHFILAYMKGRINSTVFDGVTCRAAFSFDNALFFDDATSPASTDITADGGAAHNGCLLNNDYYGNKIDITGFVGDFSLYPIWHECKNAGTSEVIATVEGSAFMIKPYLLGMPGNDPKAYPITANQITVSGAGWKIFEKFGFGLSAPTATATNATITPTVSGSGASTFGTWTWNPGSTFIQPSMSGLLGGLFYGVFMPNSASQGLLNFSDQRKAVTAGNVTFAVSETGGAVFLNQSIGLPNTSSLFDPINWTQRIQIESVAGGVTQSDPTIGIYEQGQEESWVTTFDGSSFTGQGAIAVVWTEKQSMTSAACSTSGTLVKIKMRMNEFDACTGNWNWGDVYTIISYYHKTPSVGGELADKTMAVVSPIVTPSNTTVPGGYDLAPHSDASSVSPGPGQPWPGMPCYLLGWSVTWTGPQLDVAGGCHSGLDAECTQGVGGGGNRNMINTGLYSRNWMRVLTAGGANTQITNNSNWGNWSNVSVGAGGAQPVLVPTVAGGVYNDLLENTFLNAIGSKFSQLYNPAGPFSGIETIGHVVTFPSVTSSENKWRWWDDGTSGNGYTGNNYRQEIAFSTDGQVDGGANGIGIWHTAAMYQRTAGTPKYGALIGQQGHTELQPTAASTQPGKDNEQDRNPSITINSSGQVFVSWESMVRSTTDLDAGNGNKGFWYSQIQINNTPITAPTSFGVAGNVAWILERKIVSGGSGYSHGAPNGVGVTNEWNKWLRNPSLTGFPKTRSMNCMYGESNDDFVDRDFACVQLLYWNATDNRIRARHYFELQQDYLDLGNPGDLYTDLYGVTSAPVSEGVPAPEPPVIIDAASTALTASGDFPISASGNLSTDGSLNDAYSTVNKGNSQLSHSPRQHSPRWWPGSASGVPYALSNAIAASASSALELTNTFTSPAPGTVNATFFNYRYDAYKNAVPENLANQDVEYRSEYANNGFAVTNFIFGGIRVGQENAMRNIAAAYAHDAPKSGTYRTTRDRVLSTNKFDWNSGEELSYERMLGSIPVEEPNLYSFKKTNSSSSYAVELIKEDGSNIPLESITGSKDENGGADTKRSHIINSGKSLHNVFLRCKNLGDPNASLNYVKHTLNIIYKEDGPYEITADTTMNFSGSVLSALPSSKETGISNIYPNPVTESEHQISFFINEPANENITLAMFDVLGRAVLNPTSTAATGNWQHVTIDAPKEAGAYLLKIGIGNDTKTYPIRVVR